MPLEDQLTAATENLETPGVSAEGQTPEPSVDPAASSAVDAVQQPAVEQAPAAAEATSWTGVADFARQAGIPLEAENDVAALQTLLAAYQQQQRRDYYSELGQQVAPHQAQFQQWLAEQGQRQQAQQQTPPAWRPPELRKEWLSMVERDPETGVLRSKAGYDPGIAQNVTKYLDWRENFMDRPDEFLVPLIEQRAMELVERKLSERDQRSSADQILQENSSWMLAKDTSGQFVVDPRTQKYKLTPEGVLFQQASAELTQAGLTDVRMIARLAKERVENAVLRQRAMLQSTQPQQPASQPAGGGGNGVLPARVVPQANGRSPADSAGMKGLTLRELLEAKTDGLEP
jgi:hypothetical protein